MILPYAALETVRKMARLMSVMHRYSAKIDVWPNAFTLWKRLFIFLNDCGCCHFISFYFFVFVLGYEASVNA